MDTNSPAALFSLTYYYYRKLLASFLAVSLKVFKKISIILVTSNLQTYTWSTYRISIKKCYPGSAMHRNRWWQQSMEQTLCLATKQPIQRERERIFFWEKKSLDNNLVPVGMQELLAVYKNLRFPNMARTAWSRRNHLCSY